MSSAPEMTAALISFGSMSSTEHPRRIAISSMVSFPVQKLNIFYKSFKQTNQTRYLNQPSVIIPTDLAMAVAVTGWSPDFNIKTKECMNIKMNFCIVLKSIFPLI